MKILVFPGEWQIDIMEIMRTGYEKNQLQDAGFSSPQYKEGIFLFVCFSPWRKLGYVEQIHNKSADESIRALKNAIEYLRQYEIFPKKITCDEGKEFNNEKFKSFLSKHQIGLYIIPRQYYTHNSISHLDSFIRFIRTYLSRPMSEEEKQTYIKLLKPIFKPTIGIPTLDVYISTTIGGLFVCRLSNFNEIYNEQIIIKEFGVPPSKITNNQMYLKLLDNMAQNKIEQHSIKQNKYKIGSLVHMKFLKGFASKTSIKYTINPYKIIGRIGNRFILKLDDPKEATVFFRMIYDVKPYKKIDSIRKDLDENFLEASNYFLYDSRRKQKNGLYTVILSNGIVKRNVSENQFFEYHKSIVKLNLKSS